MNKGRRRKALGEFLHRVTLTVQLIQSKALDAYSAQSAFFIILSFFPFIMLFLSICRALSIPESAFIADLLAVLPDAVGDFLYGILTEISQSAAMAVISVSAIMALWSSSRAVYALIKGMNAVYGVKENRNFFKLRFIAMIYTLVFILTMAVTLGLLVFGKSIISLLLPTFPAFTQTALWIYSFRSLAGMVLLTLIFTAMFLILPNRRSKIRRELPGAFLSAVVWILFSGLYSFYIDHYSNFSRLYGSLAAVVLLMLWLYFCMYILFLGATLNRTLGSGQLFGVVKPAHRQQGGQNAKK